jgi:hypothetical protein
LSGTSSQYGDETVARSNQPSASEYFFSISAIYGRKISAISIPEKQVFKSTQARMEHLPGLQRLYISGSGT